MAKFDAKTFNPEAFAKYMSAIPNTKLNKLRSSRAVGRDSRLIDTFKTNTQTGTVYATIPYFGLIGGAAQNYDGVSNLTPGSTKSFDQGVFTYGRMMAWTEADFAYDITGGADFMANVRQQIMEYWNAVDQDVLLAILKGIFSMTGSSGIPKKNKEFTEKHTLDVTGEGDGMVSATTLNTAIQKACGDHKSKFGLAIMHSSVATNLENLNLLAYLKYTDEAGVQRDLELATWNGRLVIIDDSMPTRNVAQSGETPAYTEYTTYLLGDGAFGFEEIGAKVPYEVARNPYTRGGEDTLISRRRNAVSVAGISYKKASQATNSPTNDELATGSNWELVNDGTDTIADKAIPIARIISRG